MRGRKPDLFELKRKDKVGLATVAAGWAHPFAGCPTSSNLVAPNRRPAAGEICWAKSSSRIQPPSGGCANATGRSGLDAALQRRAALGPAARFFPRAIARRLKTWPAVRRLRWARRRACALSGSRIGRCARWPRRRWSKKLLTGVTTPRLAIFLRAADPRLRWGRCIQPHRSRTWKTTHLG